MPEITYDAIKPLIHSEERTGGSVAVVFRCPETGVEATVTAGLRAGTDIKAVAARSVKRNLWWSLRAAVLSAINSVVGGGIGGRVAREVAGQSMSQAQRGVQYTTADVRAAVVGAFEKVQSRFRWDAAGERWVGVASADTPFGAQLAAAPVTARYDQGVLARLLVEIVCADGVVRDEEREFLAEFMDPELGTLEELAARDALSTAELTEVDAKARETMLMLAWAAALSDEDLADAEAERLAAVATAFGLAADRVVELRTHAQQFLLEQGLRVAYPDGKRDPEAHAEAMAAGAKLGLTPEAVERIDVGYRKRHGIV